MKPVRPLRIRNKLPFYIRYIIVLYLDAVTETFNSYFHIILIFCQQKLRLADINRAVYAKSLTWRGPKSKCRCDQHPNSDLIDTFHVTS